MLKKRKGRRRCWRGRERECSNFDFWLSSHGPLRQLGSCSAAELLAPEHQLRTSGSSSSRARAQRKRGKRLRDDVLFAQIPSSALAHHHSRLATSESSIEVLHDELGPTIPPLSPLSSPRTPFTRCGKQGWGPTQPHARDPRAWRCLRTLISFVRSREVGRERNALLCPRIPPPHCLRDSSFLSV